MSRGGRKLMLMGCLSIMVALVTTGISLFIYHTSGDIYLDRSRPGFLPDEQETANDQNNETYKFSDSGNLDKNTLSEYLEHLTKEVNRVKQVDNPFDPSVLSDESLGITGQTPAETPASTSDGVDTNQDANHIND